MESGNPVAGLIGLWMFLKLAGFIAVLGGGIYVLYCLSRAAAGIERIADSLDRMIAQQHRPINQPGSPYGAPPAAHSPAASAPPAAPPSPLPPV